VIFTFNDKKRKRVKSYIRELFIEVFAGNTMLVVLACILELDVLLVAGMSGRIGHIPCRSSSLLLLFLLLLL